MPEYLKALAVVLVISLVVFKLASSSLADVVVEKNDYWRRAWIFIAATLAAFLAHDFWLMAGIVALLLAFGAAKDGLPIAFYCALLFAIPPLGSDISGLGIVNYLFNLDYLRLLSITVLLPAAWRLFDHRSQRLPGPKLPDALMFAYLALLFTLSVQSLPLTSALRNGFYFFFDTWLIYYVASRSVRDMQAFREVAAAYVLGVAIMSALAIIEAARGWLLYSSLGSSLGVYWGYGNYMGRVEGGPLRAMASTGHPIVMGFLVVVALPLLVFLKATIRSRFIWWLTMATIVTGLLVTLSRGPWLGALTATFVIVGLGRGAGKRLARAGAIATVMVGLAMLSEWGRTLIDYLPFVGNAGSDTVEYRQRLFEVSINILSQSPFFGNPSFYSNEAAQELRQGEHIIDMVNSYLGIAVASGVVGLALFVGPFVAAVVLAWRALRVSESDSDDAAAVRALLAAIAGILVTIATTSSINVIPPIYLIVVGTTIGFCGQRLALRSRFGAADGPVAAHEPAVSPYVGSARLRAK